MPPSPPEIKEQGFDAHTIKLLIVDRKSIWLAQENVEWAVRYLYIQHLLKGVPLVDSDSQGPSGMQPLELTEIDSPARGSGSPSVPESVDQEMLEEDITSMRAVAVLVDEDIVEKDITPIKEPRKRSRTEDITHLTSIRKTSNVS